MLHPLTAVAERRQLPAILVTALAHARTREGAALHQQPDAGTQVEIAIGGQPGLDTFSVGRFPEKRLVELHRILEHLAVQHGGSDLGDQLPESVRVHIQVEVVVLPDPIAAVLLHDFTIADDHGKERAPLRPSRYKEPSWRPVGPAPPRHLHVLNSSNRIHPNRIGQVRYSDLIPGLQTSGLANRPALRFVVRDRHCPCRVLLDSHHVGPGSIRLAQVSPCRRHILSRDPLRLEDVLTGPFNRSGNLDDRLILAPRRQARQGEQAKQAKPVSHVDALPLPPSTDVLHEVPSLAATRHWPFVNMDIHTRCVKTPRGRPGALARRG